MSMGGFPEEQHKIAQKAGKSGLLGGSGIFSCLL